MDKHTYYITNGSNEYLKYIKNNPIKKDIDRFNQILEEQDKIYKFSCLEEKDLNEERHQAHFTKEFSSEDAYVLEKVDDNHKREILIVRSSMCLFRYFASFYKNNVGGNETKNNNNDNIIPVSNEHYVEV
jgi:hypothetical protein